MAGIFINNESKYTFNIHNFTMKVNQAVFFGFFPSHHLALI